MFKLRLFLTTLILTPAALAQPQNERLGVRVPDDFEVTLFADDDLAHDIHSLTIDSRGRLVVSGPGYVRFLIDSDDDGQADTVKEFVDGPKTGAQGMFFDGRDLICSGDGGLQVYRDDDRDDKADGPPEVFLRMRAGGEHHVHSIQRGPDGWWYVIAGNYAGVTDAYATLDTSPLKQPYAGVIMRLNPKRVGSEIVSDGFRNAYDFAITRQGDFFTFDSDGERDVSLPWYRPTRVFHAVPMSNAGWVSRSWKRPDHSIDMPPVVGAFGRGSPTGVLQYQHDHFPQDYRDAVFVLDWTYGRIMALPLKADGSVWKSEPIEFMTGVGSFGFAPTDAVVAPDGSLYVSVGGRGTRGGVYHITYSKSKRDGSLPFAESDSERLMMVLDAHQFLESWSRTRWMGPAKQLGKEAFAAFAVDEEKSERRRLRAIEILTELFGGLDQSTASALAKSESAAVRARAAWAIGRANAAAPDIDQLLPLMTDKSPLVQRFALEALQSTGSEVEWKPVLPALAKALGADDRFVRQAAAHTTSRLPEAVSDELVDLCSGDARAVVSLGQAIANRSETVRIEVIKMCATVIESDNPASLRLDAARLLQIALGDTGPAKDRHPVFEGYAPRLDLSEHKNELIPIAEKLAGAFPTGDTTLDDELSRTISMLAPTNPQLVDKLLARIDDESHPVSDIHYLLVTSRVGGDRTQEQTEKTAGALVDLDTKISRRKLPQDTNWTARIAELTFALVKQDADLPVVLSRLPDFGRPAHAVFLNQIPAENLQDAVDAFAKQISDPAEFSWTHDMIFVLGRSKREAHHDLVRSQFENESVQSSVLMVLAQLAKPADRAKFVHGLKSPDLGVLSACVNAITRLPKTKEKAEIIALIKAARRLGASRPEYQLRDTVIALLRQNTGQDFDFQAGEEGFKPQPGPISKWTEYVAAQFGNVTTTNDGAENDLREIRRLMADVDWSEGDVARGEQLFNKKSCAQCHDGRTALGPGLTGVTSRFSRADLLTSIVAPNQDVSPRYQTTLIETKAGRVFTGLVIYRSVDGLLLRTSQNQTHRIEGSDIESMRAIGTSLMPVGLLRGITKQELADLYAYLGSLRAAKPKQKG